MCIRTHSYFSSFSLFVVCNPCHLCYAIATGIVKLFSLCEFARRVAYASSLARPSIARVYLPRRYSAGTVAVAISAASRLLQISLDCTTLDGGARLLTLESTRQHGEK